MAGLFSVAGQDASRPSSGNTVLNAFSAAHFTVLDGMLRQTELSLNSQTNPHHLIFPVDAVLSVCGIVNGRPMEIGMIGSEGALGLRDGAASRLRAHVIEAGMAYYVESEDLERCLREVEPWAHSMLGCAWALFDQASEVAMAATFSTIAERVARRLLMLQDRLGSNTIGTTHQEIANRLGIRRASVTIALQVLEGEGLLRSRRSTVVVRNRAGLIARAPGIYTAAHKATGRDMAQA